MRLSSLREKFLVPARVDLLCANATIAVSKTTIATAAAMTTPGWSDEDDLDAVPGLDPPAAWADVPSYKAWL